MANTVNFENVRRKVIMVDYVGFLLMSAKERLKEQYEIYPATSSHALFEILGKVKPDIILLDINMPDEDGFKTIDKLKTYEEFEHIPVIFLSGKSDRASMIKGKNHGAVDFITKPFTDATLIESIEYQLNPVKREANKPLVLAVDDNPSILKAINTILNRSCLVRTLAKPENLGKLLELIAPDLFILDCQMPIMHGFDLIPVIRGFKDHTDTPIIFLASEGTIDNISVAINRGASDYLLKPIDENTLREKAALHLENFILRRRIRLAK